MLIVAVSLFVIGCNSSNKEQGTLLEGDLHFRWLKLGSFYNTPDSIYQYFTSWKDTVNIQTLTKNDSVFLAHYSLLEEAGLLHSPYIYLQPDSGKNVIVYFSEEDYQEFTKFTYQDLISTKQKVRIKLLVDSINDKLRRCTKVVSIDVVEGQTLQRVKKFKIEDYR